MQLLDRTEMVTSSRHFMKDSAATHLALECSLEVDAHSSELISNFLGG